MQRKKRNTLREKTKTIKKRKRGTKLEGEGKKPLRREERRPARGRKPPEKE